MWVCAYESEWQRQWHRLCHRIVTLNKFWFASARTFYKFTATLRWVCVRTFFFICFPLYKWWCVFSISRRFVSTGCVNVVVCIRLYWFISFILFSTQSAGRIHAHIRIVPYYIWCPKTADAMGLEGWADGRPCGGEFRYLFYVSRRNYFDRISYSMRVQSKRFFVFVFSFLVVARCVLPSFSYFLLLLMRRSFYFDFIHSRYLFALFPFGRIQVA